MIAPTASEANWWWVPRGLLTGEEVPQRAKQSPRALPIPSGQEVDCSRPAPVMIGPTASEANWWWVPRGLLTGEEVPQRAKQSPRALPIPLKWEARHSRTALVMVAPTASEANWWWVPRGLLTGEEFPQRAKQSPRALSIPSKWEARHSRPAPVMVAPTASEADWWSVPHGPLMDGELPPRAKTQLQEPWVAARPEVR
jgi:hypothetical protein